MKTMKKGFTLIELIVVIAIIAILALILVPQVTGYINSANDSADQASAKACYTGALANWSAAQTDVVGSIDIDADCTITTGTATATGTAYAPTKGGDAPDSATFGGWVYTGDTGAFTAVGG